MNTEQRAREILAEVTGAHVENIADFANDTSGGVTVTVPDALRAIIRALSPPASANPNAGKPELCGCGLPAEYMTNDGGWCCNKYGIKHLPASAGEGFVVSKASIDALVAGPFMHHHKMNELQEAQAKGFDRCREMTLKNIEVFFAARDAMLAAAPTPPAAEDARDAKRYRWLRGLFYIYGGKFSHDWRTPMGESLYYPRLWFSNEKLVGRDWLGRLISPIPHRPENEHETLRGKDVWPHIDALVDAAMLTSPDSGKEGDRG
jgi:hypothetical protein